MTDYNFITIRFRLSHTEAGAEDMLSINEACNTSIVETRTSPDHTDTGDVDMLSFKVAERMHVHRN